MSDLSQELSVTAGEKQFRPVRQNLAVNQLCSGSSLYLLTAGRRSRPGSVHRQECWGSGTATEGREMFVLPHSRSDEGIEGKIPSQKPRKI